MGQHGGAAGKCSQFDPEFGLLSVFYFAHGFCLCPFWLPLGFLVSYYLSKAGMQVAGLHKKRLLVVNECINVCVQVSV